MEMKDVMTVKQAAEYLGVTTPAVRLSVRAGKIKPIKIGNFWFITKESLDEYKKHKYSRKKSLTPEGNLVFDPKKNQYSVADTSKIYGVTLQRIYYLLYKNLLKFERVLSHYVIYIDDKEEVGKIVVPDRVVLL